MAANREENTMVPQFWGDADKAAALVKKGYPAEAARTVTLADEICAGEFTFRGHWEMERTHIPVRFEGEIDWQHVENEDPEWCYALNRHSFLVVLGKAWRLTGDHKYAQAARTLWLDWINRVPLTEEAGHTTWRPIEVGLRCENWLRALWLLADSAALDDTLQAAVHQSLGQHARCLLASHSTFQRLSNWGILQDHGLLLLGLAFERAEWCSVAAGRLDGGLKLQVFEDGSHWEQSPLYHCEVLHCCLSAVQAARKAGLALPGSFVKTTHKMARALALWLRPDGKLLCQSDSDEVDARDLLALAAVMFEDGGLKSTAGPALPAESLWSAADRAEDYRALCATGYGGSAVLPDSGNVMLWDGVGPGAGFLHMHYGSLGSGHGHADLLHIDLVQEGESILCDSGRYTYKEDPVRALLKSAAAHNTVRVDGAEFSRQKGSWGYDTIAEPLPGKSRFTPDIDYASGAHLGYIDAGVVHRRHVLRLGKGLWLWWDALYAAAGKAHDYEHFYHFGPEGRFEQEAKGGVYYGRNVSARLALCGLPYTAQTLRVPCSREYNRLEQHDRLTVQYTAQGFASLASVLAVGAVGDPPLLTVSLQPVTLESSGCQLPPDKAQALAVVCDGEEWTVLLTYSEAIAEVDLLSAGGLSGYGKVLVFPPGSDQAQCLAW